MDNAVSEGAKGLTKAELDALISEQINKSIKPALDAALSETITSKTPEFVKALREVEASTGFDQKSLGKFPYGRKARAIALAAIEGVPAQDVDAVAKVARKHWAASTYEPVAKWLDSVKQTKGLTVNDAAGAGAMVFPEYDPEWIELLRNNAVIRGLARVVPMPRGAMSRRKQTGAGTATYQGERGPIAVSQQSVGLANLSYKKLTAATVVSNDLIRYAGGGAADEFVQKDLIAVSGLREDRAFLVGNPPTDTGSPQGVRFQTIGANIAATAGTSLANFQTDFTNLIKLVQSKNVKATPANSGFILSPSTFWTVYNLTTTTGDWVFAQGLAQGQPRILGFPVYLTTQLEVSNSWIGASAGLSIFAHFDCLEIHDSMARTVEAFRGGAYHDGTTVQSGISNDETVITCISEHDFLQTYPEAVSIRTGLAT